MISLENVTVSFGGVDLFRGVTLQIGPRDRIGLVGRNGSGKSTLFRVLSGSQPVSAGTVNVPRDQRVGLLAQHLDGLSDSGTIMDETLTAFTELQALEDRIREIRAELERLPSHKTDRLTRLSGRLAEASERYHVLGGGQQRGQAERALMGLGFERERFNEPLNTLSGGWRMRVELAKILLAQPDLLLLDEPTNHLDIESIGWLEEYLKGYNGALVVVSHDRRFLDTVTRRTFELTLGRGIAFNVPYSQYVEQRREQLEVERAAWRNQQQTIRQTQEFIDRFRYQATKSNQVQSRIRMLERMERIEVEGEDTRELRIEFPVCARAGDLILRIEGAGKSFGSRRVFRDAHLDLMRGEKIAFVGRNGEGKSTLIKLIIGEHAPSEGTITLGHKVEIGYFAQDQARRLDDSLSVYDVIEHAATGAQRTKIRDMLAAFLFRGDDVDKRVGMLSGGERNRLALLEMILRPANFLILDEPTNHLDIAAKRVLKEALMRYEGTLLIVSHDRDFLDGLVSRVYEFTRSRVREHVGGIGSYLDTRRAEMAASGNIPLETISKAIEAKEVPSAALDTREEWKARKKRDNELTRLKRDLARLEKSIAEGETRLKEIGEALHHADLAEQKNMIAEYETLQRWMETEMEAWETCYAQIDSIEGEGDER